ncbi:hypothetical protein ACMCNP_00525 [Candidatus Acidulodesulfobacterium sp. H_13]|uniref:hypothetical protein n=1 Tax=Candidatus Acidulodesulfobacterium sp. H_13 TaxID=3395470 RepID=UPI003AF86ACA
MTKIYRFLSFALILPILFMFSGCTPAPIIMTAKSGVTGRFQRKLETRVLKISLGLSGVHNENVISGPVKSDMPSTADYFKPSFMVKTSSREYKSVIIDKTIESPNGRFVLGIESIKFKNIFGIIDFSIKNLHSSTVKYRLFLFKKTDSGFKLVAFKSNIGDGKYSYLGGLTEIKGDVVFLKRRKLSDLTLEVLILTNNLGNNSVKLYYEFHEKD